MPPMQRLNFQHLLYLQALVEERHVTRAADRMGIGQPAMSTALARLRELFQDVLLVKTNTGMEPTPRAIELIRRIREMSNLLEGRDSQDEHFNPATAQARWRILSADGISRVLLPDLMALASRTAPHMRFTVQPGDVRRLSEYLRDGDFDLAIAFVRTAPPELRQVMLYPQRLVCLARKDHPEIQGQLSLQQFISSPHARWGAAPLAHATSEAMLDEVLAQMGHSRCEALLVSSVNLLPGIVARTDLLAVVSEQLALSACDSLSLQMLTLPFQVPNVDVSLLWHERMHHDPAHKWLRSSLLDIGKSMRRASSPTG